MDGRLNFRGWKCCNKNIIGQERDEKTLGNVHSHSKNSGLETPSLGFTANDVNRSIQCWPYSVGGLFRNVGTGRQRGFAPFLARYPEVSLLNPKVPFLHNHSFVPILTVR